MPMHISLSTNIYHIVSDRPEPRIEFLKTQFIVYHYNYLEKL